MTSKRLADIVRELTPTEFSDNVLLMWISNCENTILTDVMLVSAEDCVELTELSDAPLTVPHPWDKLYLPYMQAQVAHANGEYDHYANYIALYNAYLEEYTRHIIETVNPSGGRAVRDAYYLSAYAIAVEHGFVGTVEEWLASLIGKQGEKGDPGEKGEPGEKGDPGEVTEEQAKKIAEEAAGKAMTAAEGAVTAAEDAKSTAESAKAIAKTYVVNMVKNADGTYTADKTFSELKAAHDAGQTVICSFMDLAGEWQGPCRLPLVYLDDTSMGFAAVVNPRQDYMVYAWASILMGGDMVYTATEIATEEMTEAYVVNMTKNADGTYTADKTFAALKAAHDAGKTVICSFQDITQQWDGPVRLPVVDTTDVHMGFAGVIEPRQNYKIFAYVYINSVGMGYTATEIATNDTVSTMIAAAIGDTATALSDMDSVIGGAGA